MRNSARLELAALCLWSLAASGVAAQLQGRGPNVQDFAVQVVASRNNQRLPFLVVDKVQAKVWVFSPEGKLLGLAPALLGLTVGDKSVAGLGERRLSSIRPEERTTPAGRFPSSLGLNLLGQEVLWVDYDSGISLHRAIVGLPQEQRARRLASATANDNRITYGCINVPVTFFNTVLLPTVRPRGTIVYVLPDQHSLQQVFDFLPAAFVR